MCSMPNADRKFVALANNKEYQHCIACRERCQIHFSAQTKKHSSSNFMNWETDSATIRDYYIEVQRASHLSHTEERISYGSMTAETPTHNQIAL